MMKRRFAFSLAAFVLFLSAALASSLAQVAPSATRRTVTLTAGATVSLFDPDYVSYGLGGVGAYVDLTLFHGIGVESEGRWQHIHEYQGISQDNFLIGPRVQVHRIWRATPYAKALFGFSNMNFGDSVGTGRFTTMAFGGGADIRLTRRLSLRAFDVEYQIWPDFLGTSLHPYGASAGIGYRIF
jgi:hypothetical protein